MLCNELDCLVACCKQDCIAQVIRLWPQQVACPGSLHGSGRLGYVDPFAEPRILDRCVCIVDGVAFNLCPAEAAYNRQGISGAPENNRGRPVPPRSEEHTSELQSRLHLVCRLLLEKKKKEATYKYICTDTHRVAAHQLLHRHSRY